MAKRPGERHGSCLALLRATGHAPGMDRHTADRTHRAGAVRNDPAAFEATAPIAFGVATQAGRHRGVQRREPRFRLPIAWPVAAMLVLAGVIAMLLFAAVFNADDPVDPGSPPAREGTAPMPGGR
jgi:hypothetical protein